MIVNLPLSIARCPSTRQVYCSRADSCAHAVVPHSLDRPVQDYSIEVRTAQGCTHHLPASIYRGASPAPAPAPVKDWIGAP